MGRDELVRLLLRRLAFHAETAADADFPRIEELTYLLNAAMRCGEVPMDQTRTEHIVEMLLGRVQA